MSATSNSVGKPGNPLLRLKAYYQLDGPQTLTLGFLAGNYFLCLLGYEIVRASSNSLFIHHLGATSLPAVWAVSTVAVTLTVFLYNSLVRHLIFINLLLASTVFFLLDLIVFYGFLVSRPDAFTVLAFYVWKDIHVVVLVEQVWSLANTLFRTTKAKGVYGLISAGGCLGALTGNLLTGTLTSAFGTVGLLAASLAALAAMVGLQLAYRRRLHLFDVTEVQARAYTDSCSPADGLKLVWNSNYLRLLAMMLVLSQLVTVLLDLWFNLELERQVTGLDERTRVIGLVFAVINALAIVGQLGLGPWLLRRFDVLPCLFAYPLGIVLGLVGLLLVPGFAAIIALKVFNKSMDYSLYRASKELLYIPLSYEVKYKAKATIDMFLYRLVKGIASGLMQLLVWASAATLGPLIILLAILCAAWSFVLVRLHAGYRRLEPRVRGGIE
ncbi:MAG: hypothetical protein A2284_17605 [Deltaproteobacteria bacterium RIFOXYA12_FULL_61_11]|nr:MAG: hypothetical protein A2284_17605 [Deltaproteobacteria bacterium RIFOXYA12_FULL_61_11]